MFIRDELTGIYSNALAEQDPSWLQAYLHLDRFDRYMHRFEHTRFPKQESKQQALRKQVGEDVVSLLNALKQLQTRIALFHPLRRAST